MPTTTPIHRLSKRIYGLMVEKGRQDLVMDSFKKVVETMYREGIKDVWLAMMKIVPDVSDEHYKFTLGIVEEAWASIGKTDAAYVKLYIRHSAETSLFEQAIEKGNEEFLVYFRDEIANADYVYLPYKCKICGHKDQKRKTSMKELIVCTLTGRYLRCRGCGQSPKLEEPVFEETVKQST